MKLKLLLYELFPELYIKRVNYSVEGYCCKCGDCCRYIHGPGAFAWLDFQLVTGFFDFVAQNPLDKGEFIAAVKGAHFIKEDFYTVLSEAGNIEKAVEFTETDDICKKIIK